MSEFKGTPGPWRIDDEADGFAHVASDTYHQILAGDGFLGEEGSGFFIHAIMKTEDANLIAAAPDLLEACQAADWESWDLPEYVRTKLKAALAKALGQ